MRLLALLTEVFSDVWDRSLLAIESNEAQDKHSACHLTSCLLQILRFVHEPFHLRFCNPVSLSQLLLHSNTAFWSSWIAWKDGNAYVLCSMARNTVFASSRITIRFTVECWSSCIRESRFFAQLQLNNIKYITFSASTTKLDFSLNTNYFLQYSSEPIGQLSRSLPTIKVSKHRLDYYSIASSAFSTGRSQA